MQSIGALHKSLLYLQKSIHELDNASVSLGRTDVALRLQADVHNNTCTILSHLGRYDEALEHAQVICKIVASFLTPLC